MELLLFTVARPYHRHVTVSWPHTKTVKNNVAQHRINMRNLMFPERICGMRCVDGSVFPNLCIFFPDNAFGYHIKHYSSTHHFV